MSSLEKQFKEAMEKDKKAQENFAKRLKKLRKRMLKLGIAMVIIAFFFFNSQPGQLMLKAGISSVPVWAHDAEDYGLTLYVFEKDGKLDTCATKPMTKKGAETLTSVSDDGSTALLTATRGIVENGNPDHESLLLYAMRVDDASKYTPKRFEHNGLTEFEVNTVDDVLIVLCTTREDSFGSDEMLEIALEEITK